MRAARRDVSPRGARGTGRALRQQRQRDGRFERDEPRLDPRRPAVGDDRHGVELRQVEQLGRARDGRLDRRDVRARPPRASRRSRSVYGVPGRLQVSRRSPSSSAQRDRAPRGRAGARRARTSAAGVGRSASRVQVARPRAGPREHDVGSCRRAARRALSPGRTRAARSRAPARRGAASARARAARAGPTAGVAPIAQRARQAAAVVAGPLERCVGGRDDLARVGAQRRSPPRSAAPRGWCAPAARRRARARAARPTSRPPAGPGAAAPRRA